MARELTAEEHEALEKMTTAERTAFARKLYAESQAAQTTTVVQKMALIGTSTVNGKHMQIAALYILGASYGQLSMLFKTSKSSVHSAVYRNMSISEALERPKGHNAPLITLNTAARYFELLEDAGPQPDAGMLAKVIANLAANKELDNMIAKDVTRRIGST